MFLFSLFFQHEYGFVFVEQYVMLKLALGGMHNIFKMLIGINKLAIDKNGSIDRPVHLLIASTFTVC